MTYRPGMNPSLEAFAATLDKAHYIRYDPDGILLVWNGSITVQAYMVTSTHWQEVEGFMLDELHMEESVLEMIERGHPDTHYAASIAYVDQRMVVWMTNAEE